MQGIMLLEILPELLRRSRTNGEPSEFAIMICFLAILAFLFFGVYGAIMERRRCTQKVEAQCVDAALSPKGELYAPVWEFTYQGVEWRVTEYVYTRRGRSLIRKTRTLYIDPDNPEKFRRKGKSAYMAIIGWTGLLLLVFVMVVIYWKQR